MSALNKMTNIQQNVLYKLVISLLFLINSVWLPGPYNIWNAMFSSIGTILPLVFLLDFCIKKRKENSWYEFLLLYLIFVIPIILYFDYLYFYKIRLLHLDMFSGGFLNVGLLEDGL